MKTFLCVSALSSILVLSAAGAFAHDGKTQKEQDSALLKASYTLPKKDGDEFRQTLHEADEENLNLKQQVALGHADLYDLLTAPDFDRKAFIAKEQEVRKAQEQMRDNRDEAFASAAAQLTPEERRTLADAYQSDLQAMKSSSTHHHRHKQVTSNSQPASSNTSSPDDSSDGKTVSQ